MADREQNAAKDGRLTRRRFVVAGAGAAAAAGLHGVPAFARSKGPGRPVPFAVVADSHLDPHVPKYSENMRAVFEHIRSRTEAPAFVQHVGDVVEVGFPAAYEEWRKVRPAELAPLIHAVPGNHEVRWDEWAKELYLAEFEPTPYSFDAAGVHVVALDPTQLLQEPGYFAREQLEWLNEDLKRAGKDAPSVVFVHYPMSGDYFYVGNQEEFLRAVEGFNVRAVVAGHIHREEVIRVNGLFSVTLPAVLNVAAYHWVAPVTGADGAPALAITRPQRGLAGWAETPVVEISLEGERKALRRAPFLRPEVADDRSRVNVVADLHPAQDASAARARLTPEGTWGGSSNAGWLPLAAEQGGRRWRGTLPVSTLAAGLHRLQVQASAADGARWETVQVVELPATAADPLRLAWERDLGASIQAGMAPLPGDGLVAATVAGAVVALDGGSRERWRRQANGPVYGTPVTDPAGRRVFVPTATGAVHAFDAADGREAWRFTAPRPALGAPVITADGETLIAPAGRVLHALDATSGAERWAADVGGFVGGRPTVDDRAVYVGAGDGKAHAFSLATGNRLWERPLGTARARPYLTLIYGPWATRASLLPGDRVLVATVTHAYALDRSTGASGWEKPGGFMYNAALLLADRLIMVDEWGMAVAVDPLTGSELWRTKRLPQRVLGGSPTLWKGMIAVAGVNGMVALLDPATGADAGRLRPGADDVHSAPEVAGDLVVVGSQDGRLRALQTVR